MKFRNVRGKMWDLRVGQRVINSLGVKGTIESVVRYEDTLMDFHAVAHFPIQVLYDNGKSEWFYGAGENSKVSRNPNLGYVTFRKLKKRSGE